MEQWIAIGYPRKRTAKTAAAEALRMDRDWYERLGSEAPRKKVTAVERMRDGNWAVRLEPV